MWCVDGGRRAVLASVGVRNAPALFVDATADVPALRVAAGVAPDLDAVVLSDLRYRWPFCVLPAGPASSPPTDSPSALQDDPAS